MADEKDGQILKYPTELANAVAAAEKAAEMVQEASEQFLKDLSKGYRRRTKGGQNGQNHQVD